MKFLSTRSDTAVSLDTALSKGLAADGGLFVPQQMPTLALSAFDGAHGPLSIAHTYLQPFFEGSALAPELADIVAETFNFPMPLVDVSTHVDAPLSVLELFHGPTAAFKDVGAQFLAACLTRLDAAQSHQRPLTILVATSGDTGGAVASAFDQRPGVRVVVLFPKGRVSPRQQHQLTCWGDNVTALSVDGSFDDCQRLVKAAFVDDSLNQQCRFSSANSINIGRLLPQSVYYAVSSLTYFRAHGVHLNWLIPTGNLGNGLAAVMARAVGMPIGDITFVSNANKTLPDYFSSGDYEPRESIATVASAMDVGAPSNLERLRYLFGERDALVDRGLHALSIDDAAIREQIRADHHRLPFVWCPHSATAMHVWDALDDVQKARHWAVVATAHPAKFDTIVEPLVGSSVEMPSALAALMQRPTKFDTISPDLDALRTALV
ncbi:MAG: threonine synthase [Pseudomonadota bacterium]